MNSTVKNHRFLWVITVLYTGFIFFNSLQNGENSSLMSGTVTRTILQFLSSLGFSISFESAHHFIRKAAHFSEYFVLGCLVFAAVRDWTVTKNQILCVSLWMVCTPLCDELIQHFTDGRYGDFRDVLLDMSGYFCGALLTRLLLKKKKR